MTYYGKQRMESFKRAMFASQLSDGSPIARDVTAPKESVDEQQLPWFLDWAKDVLDDSAMPGQLAS